MNGVYLSANPAYAKIVGQPLEQIVGKPIIDVMGRNAAVTIRPYVDRVLRGEHVVYETQVPLVGRGPRYLHVSYTPEADAAGEIVGWVASVTDITDGKLIELALRENHTALQERTLELERRTIQLTQMASDLTLAEQHAREALAKTLHDGLQQLLVIAAMKVESYTLAQPRGAVGELLEAKTSLDNAITAARSLSVDLFPPVLHVSGLPKALTWLSRWRERHQST